MLTDEDAKLVTLARQARARIDAPEGAAVRDEMGRSYSSPSIAIPGLQITALQFAIAQAVAAGAHAIEAAVVVTHEESLDMDPLAHFIVPDGVLHICSPGGDVLRSVVVTNNGIG